MTLLVTVRFPVDIAVDDRLNRDHPETLEALKDVVKRHPPISHRRFVGDGSFLDLEEWESQEALDAFLAEARPIISERSRLRGAAAEEATWFPL
jgi:hypothetical protein